MENLITNPSILIRLMDILLSPADVDVGAGDEGSEDRKDGGSLLHPAPVR